jgi:iron complex transport system ATP-binding protein
VLVTHHLEEIPTAFTHALVLKDGAAIGCGKIVETLTSATLSECFEVPLRVEHRDGRFTARLA